MKFVPTIIAVLLVATAGGQDNPGLERQTLKGLNAVYIFIGLSKDFEDAGLSADDIKTDAKSKIRRAGIRVIETENELTKTPGHPYLLIAVEGSHVEAVYPYWASVGLNQRILLARDVSIKPTGRFSGGTTFTAETWSVGIVGVRNLNQIHQIRGEIESLVDKFVEAYLSVNPKK